MTEPVTFVVERHAGRELPCIYVGPLPTRLTRKIGRLPDGTPAEPNPVVYALRLDKLSGGADLANRAVDELYKLFCHLRERGTLPPPNLTEPTAKSEGRKGAILGEHWEPPVATWDRAAPGRPYPQPGDLKPKHDAAAYIGQRGGYLRLHDERDGDS